ncbi:MAG: hypothetical protein Q9162_006227 [Coniocarpon cinnabarinum]
MSAIPPSEPSISASQSSSVPSSAPSKPTKLTILYDFLLPHIQSHISSPTREPLLIAFNGIQGSGKTTLVAHLAQHLSNPSSTPSSTPTSTSHSNADGIPSPDRDQGAPPPPLRVATLSLDDFYHPRLELLKLKRAHKGNALLQTRGQPGTHDTRLCLSTLRSLKNGKPVSIPRYDKSAFNGEGDRLPASTWDTVSDVDVILFEGWSLGFRPLGTATARLRHSTAQINFARLWEKQCAIPRDAPIEADIIKPGTEAGRLGNQKLEDVLVVDKNLRDYEEITELFDLFVHLDSEDLQLVYEWREEQEEKLRREKGTGMSKEKVIEFVNGCMFRFWSTNTRGRTFEKVEYADESADYPSYEMYTDVLRQGILHGKGKQLRLRIGRDREVVSHKII